MGVYNSISANCPHCGEVDGLYEQFKPGNMDHYKFDEAPDYYVAECTGPLSCSKCGKWSAIAIDTVYTNRRLIKLDKRPD